MCWLLSQPELHCMDQSEGGISITYPIKMCLNWASVARQSFDLRSLLCTNRDDEFLHLHTHTRAHTQTQTHTGECRPTD